MRTRLLTLSLAVLLIVAVACADKEADTPAATDTPQVETSDESPMAGVVPDQVEGIFAPAADTVLEAGEHQLTELSIPKGVAVTLEGDVSLQVDGPARIEGQLTGDCVRLEIRTTGELVVDGLVTNSCSGDEVGPEMRLIAQGDITLGVAPSDEPLIIAAGDLIIADPEGEAMEMPLDEAAESGAPTGVQRVSFRGHSQEERTGNIIVNRPLEAGPGGKLNIVTRRGDLVINANLTTTDSPDAGYWESDGTCDALDLDRPHGGSMWIGAPEGHVGVLAGVALMTGDGGAGWGCVAGGGCPAKAVGGTGGSGGGIAFSGETVEFMQGARFLLGDGGAGGSAEARASNALDECANGCDAEAWGGHGGGSKGIRIYVDEKNLSGKGNVSISGGKGGDGGSATATGSDGMDCSECPRGSGGIGGDAQAIGGDGGVTWNDMVIGLMPLATLYESYERGAGGDADAVAGAGGDGATCCEPPQRGGDGGTGGSAVARAGNRPVQGVQQDPSWQLGELTATRGRGGDGGDGMPAGTGGVHGVQTTDPGTQLVEGKGVDGQLCPALTTTWTDEQVDAVDCATLNPLNYTLPGYADVGDIVLQASPGQLSVKIQFPRVTDLEQALADGGVTSYGVGVMFADPERPLLNDPSWAFNNLGHYSYHAMWNYATRGYDTFAAEVQGNTWIDSPGPGFWVDTRGQWMTLTMTVTEVMSGYVAVVDTMYYDSQTGVLGCDAAGLVEGQASIVVPQVYHYEPEEPAPEQRPTETPLPPAVEPPFPGLPSDGDYAYPAATQVLWDASPPHKEHVALWERGGLYMTVTGDQVTFTGDPPWVSTSGTLHEDGTFWTEGYGTVATYQGIHATFAGEIDVTYPMSLPLTGELALGDNGGLPGGGSIGFLVNGTLVEAPVGAGEVQAETVPEFTIVFVNAMQTGDTLWLYNRLHDQVIIWYGEDQCSAYLETVVNPTFDIEIVGQSGPEPWAFERDGLSTMIPGVDTVQTNVSANGQTNPVDWHLWWGPDGRYYWFTDCGEPMPAGG